MLHNQSGFEAFRAVFSLLSSLITAYITCQALLEVNMLGLQQVLRG